MIRPEPHSHSAPAGLRALPRFAAVAGLLAIIACDGGPRAADSAGQAEAIAQVTDPAAARSEVLEAEGHYDRILPLVRNLHNAAAASEMVAATEHLDRAIRLTDPRGIESAALVLRQVRATATGLARLSIGVPPDMASSLEVLRRQLAARRA